MPPRPPLKTVFNKWRLALLVVIGVYAFLLLWPGALVVQWDEVPHLYGGLLLSHGQIPQYLSFYGYYPPLYDLATAGFYSFFGASAAVGRLTAALFAFLSIWVTFEFAYKTYGPKTALTASILLGSMAGFYWISNFALLESMLIFFFSLTLFFFFSWLNKNQNNLLLFAGLALGLGFLAKYQTLVAALVMVVAVLLLGRNKLRHLLPRVSLIFLVAFLVAVPWLLVIGFGHIGELLYAVQVGGQDRTLYSVRYPVPIFYLVELAWAYSNTHPILLPVYVLGLAELGLWIWRRKREDLFFLSWFLVVYLFFTLLPNRQWRYVLPMFPVLAISAANFCWVAYEKLARAWKSAKLTLPKRRLVKAAAVLFMASVAASVLYGYYDGQNFIARYQTVIPVQEAANYAAQHAAVNQSLLVLCPSNWLHDSLVKFYLQANATRQIEVLQYPSLPVDSYTPDFDVSALVALCQQYNVKYLLIHEYGGTEPYFNSTLTAQKTVLMLLASGSFTWETLFSGSPGNSIAVLSFSGAV